MNYLLTKLARFIKLRGSSGNTITSTTISAREALDVKAVDTDTAIAAGNALLTTANSLSTSGNALLTTIDADTSSLQSNLNNAIDSMTSVIKTIDYGHSEIHNGDTFFWKSYSTIANNVEKNFIIVTPNTTKHSHFVFDARSSNTMTIGLYEGATYTAETGTARTPFNANRNSATASVNTLIEDPTILTVGTVLVGDQITGGTEGSMANISRDEIILKQNTIYLLRLTSRTPGNIIGWKLEWYEHTTPA